MATTGHPSRPGLRARITPSWRGWSSKPDLPNAVHVHLLDALVAWAPLMGAHLFPTEPEAGADTDLRQVLEGMWWRLDAQAADVRWVDRVVLSEVRGRIGLAMQALRARPAPAQARDSSSQGLAAVVAALLAER